MIQERKQENGEIKEEQEFTEEQKKISERVKRAQRRESGLSRERRRQVLRKQNDQISRSSERTKSSKRKKRLSKRILNLSRPWVYQEATYQYDPEYSDNEEDHLRPRQRLNKTVDNSRSKSTSKSLIRPMRVYQNRQRVLMNSAASVPRARVRHPIMKQFRKTSCKPMNFQEKTYPSFAGASMRTSNTFSNKNHVSTHKETMRSNPSFKKPKEDEPTMFDHLPSQTNVKVKEQTSSLITLE